jgi:hypothetical protein
MTILVCFSSDRWKMGMALRVQVVQNKLNNPRNQTHHKILVSRLLVEPHLHNSINQRPKTDEGVRDVDCWVVTHYIYISIQMSHVLTSSCVASWFIMFKIDIGTQWVYLKFILDRKCASCMLGRHHVFAECINPMLINLGSNSFYASKINGQWFGRCGSWVLRIHRMSLVV